VRGGVSPTAKNLVALKRRRIRTRDPKSSGKPQQNRGAEVLAWTCGEITFDFPGIFPLARIRARSRCEGGWGRGGGGGAFSKYFELETTRGTRPDVAGRVYLLPLPLGSGAAGGGVAQRRPRPLVTERWLAGLAPWRSRGFVPTGGAVPAYSIAMNGQLPRRGPRDGPGRAAPERACCDVALPGFCPFRVGLGEARHVTSATLPRPFLRLRNCGRLQSLHRRTRTTTTRRHYRRSALANRCFVSSCQGLSKCLTNIPR
jgi:hypothetical protein